jgi:hypothetical protein
MSILKTNTFSELCQSNIVEFSSKDSNYLKGNFIKNNKSVMFIDLGLKKLDNFPLMNYKFKKSILSKDFIFSSRNLENYKENILIKCYKKNIKYNYNLA